MTEPSTDYSWLAGSPSMGTPNAYAPQSVTQQLGLGYGNPMAQTPNPLGTGIFDLNSGPYNAAPAGATPPDHNWWRGDAGVAGDGVSGWLGNGQNLSAVFQGIGALTQAYLGFQQLKAAKEGLKFQKEAYKANLANSEQTYNTSLEDRIRGRTSNYEGKEENVQSYLNANRLKQSGN